jgi:hypothetical protein
MRLPHHLVAQPPATRAVWACPARQAAEDAVRNEPEQLDTLLVVCQPSPGPASCCLVQSSYHRRSIWGKAAVVAYKDGRVAAWARNALCRPAKGPPPCMEQHPVMRALDLTIPASPLPPDCSLDIEEGGDVWAVDSRSTRVPRASPVRRKPEVSVSSISHLPAGAIQTITSHSQMLH